MQINNIFCVGRNYKEHAHELNNKVPEEPIIFNKPTNSLTKADGSVLEYPSNRGSIHYELEIVLYIGEEVTHNFDVDDIVTKMALGVDFTLRDQQSKLKENGKPWLLAKGFKNSAIITDFWDFPGVRQCDQTNFSLTKNNEVVQSGESKSTIFNFQTILEFINENIGLNKGDIIYTGTPEGVGPITNKDEFILKWENDIKGTFIVSQ